MSDNYFVPVKRQSLEDEFWSYRCGKLVAYAHILEKYGHPVRCPKARRHAGLCWGGEFVIGPVKI